jgi:hypothetical protein
VEHEKCKSSFQGLPTETKFRNYQKIKFPSKIFKKYKAFDRNSFCTFDFETRLDENGQHIPFSYFILYRNVFDFSKRVSHFESSWDPKALVESCLKMLSLLLNTLEIVILKIGMAEATTLQS